MLKGGGDMSLTERLEYAIRELGFWYRITIIMVLVGLVALSGIISMSQYYFHQELGKYGQIEEIYFEKEDITILAYVPFTGDVFPSDGIVTLYLTQIWLMVGNGIVIALLSFLFFWTSYRGNTHKKEFESIERQFVRQSYLINFETSLPEGDSRIEKILNQSIHVFPTLKEIYRVAKKEEKKIPLKTNQKIHNQILDAVVQTKKGNFIIKFFQPSANYQEIKNLVDDLSKSRQKIFRVLCISPQFDKVFQSNQLVDLMSKLPKEFKLDLIIEENQGYSMLWID